MLKPRVGVVRGGPSTEFEVSLKTGQSILSNLPPERYDIRDILIDKSGVWHVRGMPTTPERVFAHTDVIVNALHGAYGEDGTIQHLFDTHAVKYTGSGRLASALGMRKHLAKDYIRRTHIRTAPHRLITKDDYAEHVVREVFQSFPMPVFVKPASGGSSVATVFAQSFDNLQYGILKALEVDDAALVENFIRGREATVAVVEGFRGEELYVLPPIEIVPTKNTFFDYDEKYAGHAREVCPAQFPRETTEALMHAARTVHHTLGLRDYSRSDFIVAKDGIYFLEANTLPGLTQASLVPKALEAVGSTLPEFLDHIVGRALARV
jgi:D-alanine-D-alanine ligase